MNGDGSEVNDFNPGSYVIGMPGPSRDSRPSIFTLADCLLICLPIQVEKGGKMRGIVLKYE
jgi:hypothetical protein